MIALLVAGALAVLPACQDSADTGGTQTATSVDASAPANGSPTTDTAVTESAPTVLGHWVIYRFFGAKGLGPAALIEFAPDGFVYIDDDFNGNLVTLRYQETDDDQLAMAGPLGLFRDQGERQGLWTYEMVEQSMILRREGKEIAMSRDHFKVRDKNVGYAFTDADQRLRFDLQKKLRAFGVAVVRHAAQNNGRIADSLTEIWAAGMLGGGDPSTLRSPLGPVGDGGMDYWLAPSTRERPDAPPRARLGDSEAPDKEILLYDRASYLSPKGVHVVFFDGHGEIMSRESFQRLTAHRANQGVNFDLPR